MKIREKQEQSRVKFGSLELGDVFIGVGDGFAWMKVEASKIGQMTVSAVNLENGNCDCFMPDEYVIKRDAELILTVGVEE